MITYATTIISFIALVYYSALLLIVARQDIRSRVRLFFSLWLLSMIVWSFSSFMMFVDPDSNNTLFWNRILVVGSMAMPISFFGFVDAFLMKERKVWLYIGIAAYLVNQVGNALGVVILQANIVGGLLFNQYSAAGMALTGSTWVFFLGFAAYDLASAYRVTKDASFRNRLRYLFLVLLAIFGGTLTNLDATLTHFPGDVVFNIISAMLITFAILRHQLLDISIVLRKGLLHSIPTLLIVASYYLVIFLALTLFHSISGIQVFFLSIIVAVVTALIVQPLRDKTQFLIDRFFFREKYDASLMLQRVSRTAAFVLDLDNLMELIMTEVISTLHIKRAAFFIRKKEVEEFELLAHRGQSASPTFKLGIDHPIVESLNALDRPLTKSDLNVMPQFKGLWDYERATLDAIGADLIIPLKVKGDVIGIFCVGPKLSGDTYTQDDQLTLTTLANQTAVAFESARLYSAEQSRREELDALYNLTRQLVANDEVDAVLQNTIRMIVQNAHVNYARILIMDGANNLRCRAVFPVRDLDNTLGDGRVEPASIRMYYDAALRENKMIVISRGDLSHDFDALSALTLDIANTLCICPFNAGDQVSGVIVLGEARQETREPFDADKLRLIRAMTDQTASAIQRARMHEQMQDSFLETVLALANAMDARDTYTSNHSQRLAFMSEMVCRELNCDEDLIQDIRWAALLHDIGKIGVPDEILRKPERLNHDEWKVMMRHPEIGARIVAPVKKLANVAPLIRSHQEHYDGTGYPDGLKGEDIPFGARLLAIADAYSAMIDQRVYKRRYSTHDAIEELRRCKGTQFDPDLVEAFIKFLKRGATRPLAPFPDEQVRI